MATPDTSRIEQYANPNPQADIGKALQNFLYTIKGITTGVGAGDVTGPASSTAFGIPLFNGATGKIIQNSAIVGTVAGSITVPAGQSITTPSVTNTPGDGFSIGSSGGGSTSITAAGAGANITVTAANALVLTATAGAITATAGTTASLTSDGAFGITSTSGAVSVTAATTVDITTGVADGNDINLTTNSVNVLLAATKAFDVSDGVNTAIYSINGNAGVSADINAADLASPTFNLVFEGGILILHTP